MNDTSQRLEFSPIGSDLTTELRTFMFADVRGYTRFTQERGDVQAALLVTKFAALVRETVQARGGKLVELRGDEALVVFRSARQALRAAVDLQQRFARETEIDPSLPLPVGIGLDAGEAVPVDQGYRGDALNLAARLCNLAGPGEVLASEGVIYLGRRLQGLSYTERGLVPLKGFADPVRVIRVVPEAEALQAAARDLEAAVPNGQGESGVQATLPIGGFLGALPPGELVSREREWDRIIAALDEVAKGSGRLVLLSGEPGIGKTRLAQEVTLKARHWHFVVATGRCYQQEQAVPYYPFLEALIALFEACPPLVRAEIPYRWPQLARLLPDQIAPLPGQVASASSDSEDQQRLFRAVTGFLQAIAETRSVALLLDDLHWADDSSLRLMQHLARHTRTHRILLLGTYRDIEVRREHPLEAALRDLGREQLLEDVEVRRLPLEGTAALVAEILGDRELPHDLTELIHHRTEGNPFFIQEMVRALVERGDVYRKDGRWVRRKVTDFEVPKSIRSVIGQRLSHLEERAQDILREASVLGQTFQFDDLLALNELAPVPRTADPDRMAWTEDEIETALDQAVVAGLLRESPDNYTFNHTLTQQTLNAELSGRRRKRLHLAAGKALERLPQRERERRAGELAWHFLEGDDTEQGLHYTMVAGDQAEKVFANAEAEQHYRQASELACDVGDEQREIEALEKLAGVLTIGARYDKALKTLERATRLHQERGDREGEACAVAQMGHVHFLRRSHPEGIARLRPLVDALERENEKPTYGLAALWAALARLYIDSGDYLEQLGAAERAIELARAVGDDPLMIGAEVTRADALWGMGRGDEALQALEDLIPRAEAAGDLTNLARALGNAAKYYARRGEFGKDRDYHTRVLAIAEKQGDRGQIVLSSLALSENAFLGGEWERSRHYLDRAESIIRTLGASHLAVWPFAARAWLALRQGDPAAASSYLDEATPLAEELSDLEWRTFLLRSRAEVELLCGHLEEAWELLQQADEQGCGRCDAAFLRSMSDARLQLGDPTQARELAAEAARRATTHHNQPDLVEALISQGAAAGRLGDVSEAEELFAKALEMSLTMPFPYGQARVLYEWGNLEVQHGNRERARERLQESLALFLRLGARIDAEAVEAALSALDQVAGLDHYRR